MSRGCVHECLPLHLSEQSKAGSMRKERYQVWSMIQLVLWQTGMIFRSISSWQYKGDPLWEP